MKEPSPAQLEQREWVGAVCAVTGWNTATMAGRAGKLARALKAAGCTPGEILRYYGQVDPGNGWWWYTADWRGKRGQRPSENGIRETCKLWEQPIAVAAPVKVEPAGYDSLRRFLERHQDANT
jgi:hypothetical protein